MDAPTPSPEAGQATAAAPQLKHVMCLDTKGLHRMAYWEWGDPHNDQVVVCVHGLSRQGRDFDTLARALCGRYRVVCPDVVGRGQSDWLQDPMGYQIPSYVADMVTLVARLNPARLYWVGTSMGGLIGMGLSSLKGTQVNKLVLNDVGPRIEPASLQRIGTYLGVPRHYATLDEAADDLWRIASSFGPHTREQWLALSAPQLKPAPQGGWGLHYDPSIAVAVRATTPELAAVGEAWLWQAYGAISCPTLLVRGGDSDLLSVDTAQAMTQVGPRARLVEFAGVGHAPTLVQPEQVQAVVDFLNE
jgi:pimeloyl-ACP methyl ester carboxylesterase